MKERKFSYINRNKALSWLTFGNCDDNEGNCDDENLHERDTLLVRGPEGVCQQLDNPA